jgi:chromosome segregation ATPase
MQRIYASVEDRHVHEIDAQVRLGNADSRSHAVRHIIDEYARVREDYADMQQQCEDMQQRLDDRVHELEERKERIDELESQLRKRSNIENDIEEVADTVENLPDKIRGVETYSERRQRKLDQASLPQRLRWKLTGVPVDED